MLQLPKPDAAAALSSKTTPYGNVNSGTCLSTFSIGFTLNSHTMSASQGKQFPPQLHNDLYPFIYPKKFQGSLQDKVTIITGMCTTVPRCKEASN